LGSSDLDHRDLSDLARVVVLRPDDRALMSQQNGRGLADGVAHASLTSQRQFQLAHSGATS
jgi:hypothetical protein